jgi:hypothetical protein
VIVLINFPLIINQSDSAIQPNQLAGIPVPSSGTPQLLETLQSAAAFSTRTIVPTATNHPVALVPASLQRSTLNVLPQTYGLLAKSRLPFGLVLHPFKQLTAEDEVVPVIGATQRQDHQQPVFAAETIVRCRRCRTYINPFVQFVDQMNWRCSVCFMLNEGSFIYL